MCGIVWNENVSRARCIRGNVGNNSHNNGLRLFAARIVYADRNIKFKCVNIRFLFVFLFSARFLVFHSICHTYLACESVCVRINTCPHVMQRYVRVHSTHIWWMNRFRLETIYNSTYLAPHGRKKTPKSKGINTSHRFQWHTSWGCQ